MSTPQTLPPKKEVALALLERTSVYIHLDPRQPAVVVPPWFKKQPQLVLQVGMHMPVPIPDLRVDDDGMSCTLSFNRAPFFCMLPWPSVFAMMGDDGRGMVWPDDVPAEVARQAQGRAGDAAAPRKETPVPPSKPGATSKPATSVARDSKPAELSAKPKRARKRPALAAVPDATENQAPRASKPPERTSMPTPPVVATAPSARPAAGGPPRKKRELPPYLRVVK